MREDVKHGPGALKFRVMNVQECSKFLQKIDFLHSESSSRRYKSESMH